MTLAVSCTSIPAIQVSDTPTTLLSATATRKPSPTFKPTRTITPTLTSSSTPSPQPKALQSVLDKYQCYSNYSESPSKEWRYYDDCNDPSRDYGNSAVLFNLRTNDYWNYPYCKYATLPFDGSCPVEGHLQPKAWSPEGHYLYITITTGGDGGSWFDYSMKLLSINLHNGFASVVVDANAVYEFSPNLNKLAYIPFVWDGPYIVYIRDLEDSTEFKLILEPKYRRCR